MKETLKEVVQAMKTLSTKELYYLQMELINLVTLRMREEMEEEDEL